MYGRVIDLEGQQCLGMQHVANLVAQDFQCDDPASALESTRRAPCTSAKEHAQAQDHPSDVVPLGSVLVKHSGSGQERYDLEQGNADGVGDIVVVVPQQEKDNEDGGC